MTASTQTNTTPFQWEKWEQLPKEEREAEMKEALKDNNQDEDPVIGETVGNPVHTIPPFPFLDVSEPTTETEAIGGHFFDTAEPEAGETLRDDGWNNLGQGVENIGQVMRSLDLNEVENDDLGGDVQKEGVNVLKKASIKGLEKKIQGPTRLVLGAPEALKGYVDPDQIEPTSNQKIREAEARGEGSKANSYHLLSPVTTHEEDLKNRAQQIHHDPDASEAEKISSKIHHGVVYTVNRTIMAPVTLVESVARFVVSSFDEQGGTDVAGQENKIVENHQATVFSSTPETLSPFNIDNALITDAYQHQDAPGADFIAGAANQGMDLYHAQREQYEVLA